jgi:hypothetical protein
MFNGGDVDVQKCAMVMITMSKMFNVNDVEVQKCSMCIKAM